MSILSSDLPASNGVAVQCDSWFSPHAIALGTDRIRLILEQKRLESSCELLGGSWSYRFPADSRSRGLRYPSCAPLQSLCAAKSRLIVSRFASRARCSTRERVMLRMNPEGTSSRRSRASGVHSNSLSNASP